ncbi:MAG: hypothetical protein R2786_05375 [Flavobacteriaceae bacterium]
MNDDSDTGTDVNGNPIPDPETVETPNGDGTTDGDPTNDPLVNSDYSDLQYEHHQKSNKSGKCSRWGCIDL